MNDDTELIRALEMSLEMVKDITDMQEKSHGLGAAEEPKHEPSSVASNANVNAGGWVGGWGGR